jgi:threonylcarbamoyladenosine tRNA methylthiotransferase MtaB
MILKRMKRRHLRDDAIRFCEEARACAPTWCSAPISSRAFPPKPRRMFDNSLPLVEACGLTWLHVFPYSPRKGTPAARMPQLDGATIKDRAARLRAVGDARVQRHLAGQIGQIHHILMENPHMGRTEQFTEVTFVAEQPEGRIVTARITGQTGQQLVV